MYLYSVLVLFSGRMGGWAGVRGESGRNETCLNGGPKQSGNCNNMEATSGEVQNLTKGIGGEGQNKRVKPNRIAIKLIRVRFHIGILLASVGVVIDGS